MHMRARPGPEVGSSDLAFDEADAAYLAGVLRDERIWDTRREDLLVDLGRALGRDDRLAHLDDAGLEEAVRIGAAEIAAATCRWLELVAELVIRGLWGEQGAASPSRWLSWALGIAHSTAREHIRVGLRLRQCPQVRERFAAGTLSYSKVRAITRVCSSEVESLLLAWADAAPAHVLERIIADARRVMAAATAPEQREDLGLERRWRDDGTYELVLRVDAPTGLAVEAYLDRLDELACTPTAPDGAHAPRAAASNAADAPAAARRPRSQRDADALVDALAHAVAAGPADESGADRHLVVVHTSAAALLATAPDCPDSVPDSAPDSAGAARHVGVLVRTGRGRSAAMSARQLWRLACTAGIDLAVDRHSHPADLGRARREPSAALRRALHARDGSCRFPGCAAGRHLVAHHVRWWSLDGPTDLDNLVLLCRHHHALIHDRGWTLRPAGRGRWTFHQPGRDGAPHPWARPLPGATAAAVRIAAQAHALDLGPDALQPPDWDGAGYDHSLAVEVLSAMLGPGSGRRRTLRAVTVPRRSARRPEAAADRGSVAVG